MEPRLKKLGAAGGPVVLRLVEHMLQRDASKRKTVQVRRYGFTWELAARRASSVHFERCQAGFEMGLKR